MLIAFAAIQFCVRDKFLFCRLPHRYGTVGNICLLLVAVVGDGND
jgi:hypothetical protein